MTPTLSIVARSCANVTNMILRDRSASDSVNGSEKYVSSLLDSNDTWTGAFREFSPV